MKKEAAEQERTIQELNAGKPKHFVTVTRDGKPISRLQEEDEDY